MTFNDSFHSSDTRKPATEDDSALGPVDDNEDVDVEPTTDQERLFLAETWGVEEALVSEFWELRKNPEARAAFTAKWGEEPEMDYFEDYIGQAAWTASEQLERDEEQEEARLLKQLEVADTLGDLMELDDEGREWLTDALITGARILTQVSTETVSIHEEGDPWLDSEVMGNYPVGDLHIFVKGEFGNTIGSFTLPGNWPAADFNPDGCGRNPEDSVNGLGYSESLDLAVAVAATTAGFTLDNAGEDECSGEGCFARVFTLSV